MSGKPSGKLLRGLGINNGKYPSRTDKSIVTEYRVWSDMLHRCTEDGRNKQQSYKNSTCSENFKSYSYFYEWCQEQIGFGVIDENSRKWQLDKDILVRGNKLYSENTCVFLPHIINSLLIKRDAERGEYLIGVCWNKQHCKFQSRCSDGCGKQKLLGYFDTEQEAFLAYKTFKESYIKQVAEQYKSQIDPRAYKALLEYEVNIDD